MIPFSTTGQKLTARSGILELMDDLGRAMTVEPDMLMLGGGNPAAVPAMQQLIRERMSALLAEGSPFDRMIGNYDPPQGNPRFLAALADLLKRTYGWDIGRRISRLPAVARPLFSISSTCSLVASLMAAARKCCYRCARNTLATRTRALMLNCSLPVVHTSRGRKAKRRGCSNTPSTSTLSRKP